MRGQSSRRTVRIAPSTSTSSWWLRCPTNWPRRSGATMSTEGGEGRGRVQRHPVKAVPEAAVTQDPPYGPVDADREVLVEEVFRLLGVDVVVVPERDADAHLLDPAAGQRLVPEEWRDDH